MTWTKFFFYLREYWYYPVAIIAAIVVFVLFRDSDLAAKLLHIKDESHDAELAAIKKAEEEEKKRKAKLQAEYEATLLDIEKDRNEDLKKLAAEDKKRIEKLVKKYNGKELAKKFAEEFQLTMVEVDDEK